MFSAVLLIALADIPTPIYEMIVVGGEWCAPCKQQAPIIQRLELEGVIVHHVDYDRQRKVAESWRVSAMPTMIVLTDRKETARFVGLTSYERLRDAVPLVRPPKVLVVPPTIRRAIPSTGDMLSKLLQPVPLQIVPLQPPATEQPKSAPTTLTKEQQIVELALACHVRIFVESRDGKVWGSGIVFNYGAWPGKTEILTNKHVVSSGSSRITIDDGTDWWKGVECREAYPKTPGIPPDDLAVILADKLPPASVALCSRNYVPVEPLYFVGSPKGGKPIVCRVSIVDRFRSQDGGVNFSISKPAISGDSGGGLIDSNGVLVGITYGDAKDGSGAVAVDLTKSSVMTSGTRGKSQKSAGQ